MNKKIYVDSKLKKDIVKTQYKKHPNWARDRKINVALHVGAVVLAIILWSWIRTEPKTHSENNEFVSAFVALAGYAFLWVIPYVHYVMVKQSNNNQINRRVYEEIVLTDDVIRDVYVLNSKREYNGLEVNYNWIQRIVYNTYHNRIDIYSKYTSIKYSNYEKGEEYYRRNIKGQGSVVRIYLYFDNNEEILKTLESKSRVVMERIDYPEI